MNKYLSKPINGYEGLYDITTDQEVISLERTVYLPTRNIYRKLSRRVLKPGLSSSGYLSVALHNHKQDSHNLHVLIARAFIPNPRGLPEVNHKDGDKLNNNIDNLEWCTYGYNLEHAWHTGLRQRGAGGCLL